MPLVVPSLRGFGQIVAIALWVPALSECIHLEIREFRPAYCLSLIGVPLVPEDEPVSRRDERWLRASPNATMHSDGP